MDEGAVRDYLKAVYLQQLSNLALQATLRGGYPWVSRNPRVQLHYIDCRQKGTSHNLAEMFALGQAPMANTDREFLEGRENGRQFEKNPELGDFYRREAEARGADVTGKVYLSGLAAFPGDPRAWVSGRGDVRRLCEDRGWGCEGSVSVPVRNVAETGGKYEVAPELVMDRAADLAANCPGDRPGDLVEKAREQLSPNWK